MINPEDIELATEEEIRNIIGEEAYNELTDNKEGK